MNNYQQIFGTTVLDNSAVKLPEKLFTIPGYTKDGKTGLDIDKNIMSKHMLLLGGSGCGKTNVYCYIMENIIDTISQDDVVIVFDTKGEFYELFHRDEDYVIGNSSSFRDISYTWNIFDEVTADGWDDYNILLNAAEIASALFHERGSKSQPFFCNAARDIFKGVLVFFIRQAREDYDKHGDMLNNKALLSAFKQFEVSDYIYMFDKYDDLKGLRLYFGDGKSNQALGVFGELNSMLSDYFVGIFADTKLDKQISMRNFIRSKGGKLIFIEYDLSVGEVIAPIYRLLIDQALKEALSRNSGAGKVYLIADEFKLMPNLQHIDDALNFGRGLGVSVVAGIQSIYQLYDIYGVDKGNVLAGGFGTIMGFHTNDNTSREYISNRFGKNVIVYDYVSQKTNSYVPNEREGYCVEDWHQTNLGVGQAVIGLVDNPPFLFQFDEYGK